MRNNLRPRMIVIPPERIYVGFWQIFRSMSDPSLCNPNLNPVSNTEMKQSCTRSLQGSVYYEFTFSLKIQPSRVPVQKNASWQVLDSRFCPPNLEGIIELFQEYMTPNALLVSVGYLILLHLSPHICSVLLAL